jgi:hypothetical protein
MEYQNVFPGFLEVPEQFLCLGAWLRDKPKNITFFFYALDPKYWPLGIALHSMHCITYALCLIPVLKLLKWQR